MLFLLQNVDGLILESPFGDKTLQIHIKLTKILEPSLITLHLYNLFFKKVIFFLILIKLYSYFLFLIYNLLEDNILIPKKVF